jgi:hypothetical protein
MSSVHSPFFLPGTKRFFLNKLRFFSPPIFAIHTLDKPEFWQAKMGGCPEDRGADSKMALIFSPLVTGW